MSAGDNASAPPGTEPRTYQEALAALESRGRYGIRLGLGRVRALLRELDNPERSVRGALVGGTNGKGSVIALAGAALRAAGYRVGETPKPHLVTYRERIVVDGRPIDAVAFARLVDEVLPAADRVARRLGPPTEFELLTAMVFRHFAGEDLDVALVEVGLGGRLDATNAWDGGVAVVTNVGLDHMDRLGPTVTDIAREKAAIVKRGDRAVTGATGDALAVVRRRCARMGVPLLVAEPAPVVAASRDGQRVRLPVLGELEIGLRGRHQAANVAVADGLLDALEAAGLATVGEAARRSGYGAARWPGRLELVRGPGGREILLDGAHNEDGAAALAAALEDLRPLLAGGGSPATDAMPDAEAGTSADAVPGAGGRLTLVWASMADKDVGAVLRALAVSPWAARASVVCTEVGLPRSLPPEDLAAAWRAVLPEASVRTAPDPDAALDLALRDGRGLVVVAGSLYLVGAVRARLVDDPLLRDPVTA